MERVRVREICKERLDAWTNILVSSHATPVILVAVGHDHNKGELHIITLEEMGNKELSLLLAGALEKILDGEQRCR